MVASRSATILFAYGTDWLLLVLSAPFVARFVWLSAG
jgi:hypothetical protein